MTRKRFRNVLLCLALNAAVPMCGSSLVLGQGQQPYPQNQQEVQYVARANLNNAPNFKGNLAPIPQSYPAANISSFPDQNFGRQALTIQQVCDLAVQNNPSVVQATRQMEAHYGSWVQAGLQNNPMVGYMADEMGGYKGAGRQGVTFSQEYISRDKRDARQGAASAEYRAAQQGLMVQRQKVINNASLVGYRLLIAQQKEYLSQELLKISANAAQAANDLSQAKESPKTDFLQAQVEMNRAQITLNDATIEREAASKELAVLLGYPTDTMLEISDTLDQLPMDIDETILLQQLISQSPQMRRAQADLDAARARLCKEQKEAGINVSTEGSLLYNTYEKQTEVTVGVAIPLRIHDKNQGNIRKATSELQAAARNIERVEKSLTSEFYNRFSEYKTARQRVNLYQQTVLSQVEESLQLMMQSYQHGQSNYVDLLNAQRTMFNVKIEYLDNIALLMSSSTKINGFLLDGAFDKPE